MKKFSFKQKLRYWFDNLMSKGTASLLLLLAVITTIVVVIGGMAAVLLRGADGTGSVHPGRSIWFALMHAINTGVLAKEEGTAPYLAVMTIVTLVGIFITSFLIGTISNGIKDKVTDLQRGKSCVIEVGHTIIIGFDDNIISIIEELVMANENQQGAVLVVMAEEDKLKMERFIHDRIPNLGNVRLVCRTGSPDNKSDLMVCSPEYCKSIIVNLNDDFMTVKTILLCKNILDQSGNTNTCILATVRDNEIIYPAKFAGGDRVEVLNFKRIISWLMVQSGRHPGISEVLSELLSFAGNEIYVEEVHGLTGLTLNEINLRLSRCVAIGMVRNGKPILNCDAETVFEPGDQLIRIDLDDDPLQIEEPARINDSAFGREAEVNNEPHTLLVLGYTDMLGQILTEENSYAVPGSRVIVAVEKDRMDEEQIPDPDKLPNIEVDVRECKIFKRSVLEELVAERPNRIMLMSDAGKKGEEADARTLMLQLQLNDIAKEIGSDTPLTIEMNSSRNQQLSQMMRATDFVVSSSITAKMMVQIAEQRHNKAILEDLLVEEGSTIYMKPIARYAAAGEPVDTFTLRASAARYGEVAIGYKKFAPDGSFSILLNPPGEKTETFCEADDLIVIAAG